MTALNRILIIRPSALGDVCRTVPVLASLRAAHPDARIDWVVQAGFEDAIRAHPMLDHVIKFPRNEFTGWWWNPRIARDVLRWAQQLRHAKYDAVFDCQGLGRSGAMTWVTRSPRRIGLRSAREGAWLSYTRKHPNPPSPHTVDHMLWLLECEGIDIVRDMRLFTHDEDESWWAGQRRERALEGGYAVLAPTSRWMSKRWPIESWSALIAPMRERGIEHAVVIGAPGERDQVQHLVACDGVHDLVGAATIGQTMAVIRSASLVIANDSAPLHMAVGFDRPSIGLFGPTDPARVGPYTRGLGGHSCAVISAALPTGNKRINFRDDALGDSLMRTIAPERVVEEIDVVFAGSEQTGAGKRTTLDVHNKPTPAGTDASPEVGFASAPSRTH